MKQKLFTKSAFKTALTCPRQLYYYFDSKNYANQNNDDGFLQALAEGGFQVGELAKIYYGVDADSDIKTLDYVSSIEQTKKLFERDDVCIAEAAFRYKNCFVRVDLLKKNDNTLELIEVKAKSWDEKSSFNQKKNSNRIASDILPYLYDVAFQKWVVTNALKKQYPDTPYTVKAFLMMADKDKTASVDGMNQYFRIDKDENKRIKIKRGANAEGLKDGTHILTSFPVDEYCDKIIRGETEEQQAVMGDKFEDFVEKMADNYCSHKKAECKLSAKCFTCPFHTTPKDSPTLKDGYKECWKEIAKFTDEDFEKPHVKDLWGAYIKRGGFIKDGKYFLKDLSLDDLKTEKIKSTVGLHHIERKLLQIGLATNNKEMLLPFQLYIKDGVYLDVEGLQEEMKNWKFPLHMIDFETTAVALPFYKGLRPYEQVAFQFSHHIIRQADNEMGYTIEHIGQYLNTKKGYFPNFDFVRELKMQLEHDGGSVFRYANHENTILRNIHEQLQNSNEPDKEELMAFIDSITHEDKVVGKRDMIDLLEVVKLYFYHPIMKGSNSIKVVLPAVLNSSELLKKKYSQPIYGKEITSKNYTFDSPRTWIAYKETGEIDNPYKRLESISSLLNVSEEELSQFGDSLDEVVCDGGAALAAYSKLQFSDDAISEALETALLRYCELDTLAMVFIWEYFNEMISLNKAK